jgi:hypothetical protein
MCPGAPTLTTLAAVSGKAREEPPGQSARTCGGKKPRRGKPREARGRDIRLKTGPCCSAPTASTTLDGRLHRCGDGEETQKVTADREVRTAPAERASKGHEPQERDRDETSPIGRAGSNASRGCETLRAQPVASVGSMPQLDSFQGDGRSARLEKRCRGEEASEGCGRSRGGAVDGGFGRRRRLSRKRPRCASVKPCKGAEA